MKFGNKEKVGKDIEHSCILVKIKMISKEAGLEKIYRKKFGIDLANMI